MVVLSLSSYIVIHSSPDVPRMLGMIHGEAGESSFWSMAKYVSIITVFICSRSVFA